jgi:hypothetical protein
MARIQEELYVVKLSKLIRSSDEDIEKITDNDFVSNLQAILQEMTDTSIIVEVEKLEQ